MPAGDTINREFKAHTDVCRYVECVEFRIRLKGSVKYCQKWVEIHRGLVVKWMQSRKGKEERQVQAFFLESTDSVGLICAAEAHREVYKWVKL